MYFNELRYNFESKSQLPDPRYPNEGVMYFNELRYNFESKSQPLKPNELTTVGCISMN
ncbi:hypothetical protein KL86DYS2_12138 [uncultured Dysgonomonas sp.]|uniref:Uncharacterized protein n=1 Tax=uncultured Dysgonomonas sp. TaxID=206096 RepID=A0A212JR25_9BACT|nr:hypothetical protein KL86DYS2_12138 [uncultured Dysgonomonas sp.]